MTVRNLESRIAKIETARRRTDEVLVIWRKPGETVSAAASKASIAPGDRAICLEWFKSTAVPAPRWYADRITKGMPAEQQECLTRSLESVAEGEPDRDPCFLSLPPIDMRRIAELSDNDLLYAALGVAA